MRRYDGLSNLFVDFGLDDFFAAIVARRRHMVAQMRFTGGWLDGQRWVGQEVVRAMHAALGR